jgi:hypothetical protein
MTILSILLGLILSVTVDARAQTFTRGQWTQWGVGLPVGVHGQRRHAESPRQFDPGTPPGNWGGSTSEWADVRGMVAGRRGTLTEPVDRGHGE